MTSTTARGTKGLFNALTTQISFSWAPGKRPTKSLWLLATSVSRSKRVTSMREPPHPMVNAGSDRTGDIFSSFFSFFSSCSLCRRDNRPLKASFVDWGEFQLPILRASWFLCNGVAGVPESPTKPVLYYWTPSLLKHCRNHCGPRTSYARHRSSAL